VASQLCKGPGQALDGVGIGMADDKENPNRATYKGEVVDGQVTLTSVQYPSEFVGEDGNVAMTCEPVEVVHEYPFATSPFCDEPRPPEIARDVTVMHKTVGGRGVVGRIK